ncbi:MAG: ABC transporter substrate-binding protein, partial [Deltaproteobacteria bacterium]|nr:ABC transporter substrate-binding protein [Deltaproteobacteria bacterium]
DYAKGNRIGYLSGDSETERKIVSFYNMRFFDGKMRMYLVKTFEEFKNEFLRAQDEVDMLFIYNHAGIKEWDAEAAKKFLAQHTKIPTGAHTSFMVPFVMFNVSKYAEEQGSYAARTVLKILDGAKPSDIPLTTNKRSKLTVNLKMAKAAGIVVPISVLKRAVVVGQESLD